MTLDSVRIKDFSCSFCFQINRNKFFCQDIQILQNSLTIGDICNKIHQIENFDDLFLFKNKKKQKFLVIYLFVSFVIV